MLLLSLCLVASASGDPFPGWQGLRVIKSEDRAFKMMPLRLSKAGGSSLLVVNTRQSRFDIYSYVGKREEGADLSRVEDPNFLPFAEDFEKTEIPLPRLPFVATAFDLDGDGVDEIVYVQGDPRKLIVLERDDSSWKPRFEWEVSEGDLSTAEPILVRRLPRGAQALLSFKDGIQMVELKKGGSVDWMQPREEAVERNRWWLADLDGDGDADLVEALDAIGSPVRWYEAEGESLRPAVNISDKVSNTNVARVLRTKEGPMVAFLGANQANSVSLYRMGFGEESALGRRNLLPLARTDREVWASLELKGDKAIVELGRDKPVLRLYALEGGFWQFKDAFPSLSNATALRAVRNKRNTILIAVADEGRLFFSEWEKGRFSFPKPLGGAAEEAADWKILAFDQYEDEVWWVTQRNRDLVLSIWGSGDKAPREIVYPSVEGEYENCVWLGGDRLLARKKFSKSAEILRLQDGRASSTSSRFKSSDFRRLQYFQGELFLVSDGVARKMDANLQALDQIMLEGDASIRSFAPVSATSAYVLEEGGERLHLLKTDKTGIYRSVERFAVPTSLGLAFDPVLGLTLVGSNHINLPSPGRSAQLVLADSLDPNENSIRGYDKKRLSTLFVVDVQGDGWDEIAAVDYSERDIFVYGVDGDQLKEVISWKVFDDGKYPYGQDSNVSSNANPYRIVDLDFDGDSRQDLVLASHDRIVIYLAKEH